MEVVYIRKILDAYEDFIDEKIENHKKLEAHHDLKKDFDRQRANFFFCRSIKRILKRYLNIRANALREFKNRIL